MRSGAWRTGHDHAGRYEHGEPEGSHSVDEGRGRKNRALKRNVRSGKRMNKDAVRERVIEIGIIPVVRASSREQALLSAGAVAEGGIAIVEITMTVAGALEVVRDLGKSACTGLHGAGRVV